MSFLLANNRLPLFPFANREPLLAPIRTVAGLGILGSRVSNVRGDSICLTFDDGPDPVYTPKILNVLADHQVKATFFVLGEAAEKFPHLIEQMLIGGHTIGNHTYSHCHPWFVSSEQARREVSQTNIALKNITGIVPRWFRPPFGRLRTAMRRQVELENMSTVLWSHSVIDWGMLGTNKGISKRLDQIKAGDIVLLHDGRPEHNRPDVTYQCLPEFLQTLDDKSLVARSLDETYCY